jgi:hypothetical protein
MLFCIGFCKFFLCSWRTPFATYGWITKSVPYCVSEGKQFEASNAAMISQNKQVKLRENEPSKESNANMAVTVVGITAGLIVVAFIIFGMIALTQKRGMFHLGHKWSEMLE